jgi:hypothetical protein
MQQAQAKEIEQQERTVRPATSASTRRTALRGTSHYLTVCSSARPPPQANQVVTLKQKLEKEKANTRELTMVRPPRLIHSCAETRA